MCECMRACACVFDTRKSLWLITFISCQIFSSGQRGFRLQASGFRLQRWAYFTYVWTWRPQPTCSTAILIIMQGCNTADLRFPLPVYYCETVENPETDPQLLCEWQCSDEQNVWGPRNGFQQYLLFSTSLLLENFLKVY